MSDQASTHITDLTGSIQSGTNPPSDRDPAGVEVGEQFVNWQTRTVQVVTSKSENGPVWRQAQLTTTSTTTS